MWTNPNPNPNHPISTHQLKQKRLSQNATTTPEATPRQEQQNSLKQLNSHNERAEHLTIMHITAKRHTRTPTDQPSKPDFSPMAKGHLEEYTNTGLQSPLSSLSSEDSSLTPQDRSTLPIQTLPKD